MTAVELLPSQQFLSEPELLDAGLVNYWGYNTIGFFAPHAAYSASGPKGEQVREFKQMVKNLHAAGLEVIMDVVYNHTAESEPDRAVLLLPRPRRRRLLPRATATAATSTSPAAGTPCTSPTGRSSSW